MASRSRQIARQPLPSINTADLPENQSQEKLRQDTIARLAQQRQYLINKGIPEGHLTPVQQLKSMDLASLTQEAQKYVRMAPELKNGIPAPAKQQAQQQPAQKNDAPPAAPLDGAVAATKTNKGTDLKLAGTKPEVAPKTPAAAPAATAAKEPAKTEPAAAQPDPNHVPKPGEFREVPHPPTMAGSPTEIKRAQGDYVAQQYGYKNQEEHAAAIKRGEAKPVPRGNPQVTTTREVTPAAPAAPESPAGSNVSSAIATSQAERANVPADPSQPSAPATPSRTPLEAAMDTVRMPNGMLAGGGDPSKIRQTGAGMEYQMPNGKWGSVMPSLDQVMSAKTGGQWGSWTPEQRRAHLQGRDPNTVGQPAPQAAPQQKPAPQQGPVAQSPQNIPTAPAVMPQQLNPTPAAPTPVPTGLQAGMPAPALSQPGAPGTPAQMTLNPINPTTVPIAQQTGSLASGQVSTDPLAGTFPQVPMPAPAIPPQVVTTQPMDPAQRAGRIAGDLLATQKPAAQVAAKGALTSLPVVGPIIGAMDAAQTLTPVATAAANNPTVQSAAGEVAKALPNSAERAVPGVAAAQDAATIAGGVKSLTDAATDENDPLKLQSFTKGVQRGAGL